MNTNHMSALTEYPAINMSSSINMALHDSLQADERTMLIGEDIGPLGGVFRVTTGLLKTFGESRVVNSPLGEAGIVGTAIGLAMSGYRPVCEIQFDGFVFPAMNQITTQLAKLHHRSRGTIRLPIVIRIPVAGGIGAIEHHSESPESYFAQTPGLRVVTCSTPQNAYSLLRASIDSDDPVIFLEPKSRYWDRGVVDPNLPMSIDTADLLCTGEDIVLIAYGATVKTALEARAILAEKGIGAAVVELCSLAPLDIETLVSAVSSVGRAIVIHEASLTGGLGAEIATRVTEGAFYYLEAPVARVTGFDTPYPPSRLEHGWLPNVERVLDAVEQTLDI
jgi:2-oxoisovalerate dehydrogenase E1 component beta subunit